MNRKRELVFVYGAYHDEWCWENLIPYFTNLGYDCIINKFRKHKKSGFPTITMDDYVDDLYETVGKTKDKPILIVHSMGSAVLQRYLKKYLHTIAGLVLIAPTAPTNTFWEMMKVQIRCIGKKPEQMFFSGRVKEEQKYLQQLTLLPARARIQVLIQVLPGRFKLHKPCLVMGSFADHCIPVSSILRSGEFFSGRTVLFHRMCHDMMLDREWRKAAKEIEMFICNQEVRKNNERK